MTQFRHPCLAVSCGLVLTGLACATAPRDAAIEPNIEVIHLVPTVDGLPVAAVSEAAGGPDNALSGISWSSFWNPGGSVLFFADHTLCVRRAHPARQGLIERDAGASRDIRPDLLRVDLKGIEAAALEAGTDLRTAEMWLVTRISRQTGATAARDDTERHARAIAAELIRAGVATSVKVALVDGDSNGMDAVLLPPHGERAITDSLPLTMRGPKPAPVNDTFDVLLAGPETKDQVASDVETVHVWNARSAAEWTVPFFPTGEPPDRDRRWLMALRAAHEAIAHGCVLSN